MTNRKWLINIDSSTVTYSVKSDCCRIGVPFTRSKKAEAERIFISTFLFDFFFFIEFRFRTSSQDFDSIRFFLFAVPKSRMFADTIYFKTNWLNCQKSQNCENFSNFDKIVILKNHFIWSFRPIFDALTNFFDSFLLRIKRFEFINWDFEGNKQININNR